MAHATIKPNGALFAETIQLAVAAVLLPLTWTATQFICEAREKNELHKPGAQSGALSPPRKVESGK